MTKEKIKELGMKAKSFEKQKEWAEAMRIWQEIEGIAKEIAWNDAMKQAQSVIKKLTKKLEKG